MSVITRETHNEIMRRLKRRAVLSHGVWFLLVLALLVYPYVLRIQKDLVTEAYNVAKAEFDNVLARQKLLTILRTRSLSISQGLDIADAVLGQKMIPASMVLAIMEVESSFDPAAVSPKGARGLLQPMPLTAKTYAGGLQKSIHDPIVNINSSLAYLGDLKNIYRDDWTKILRTYNGGPKNSDNRNLDGYVRAVLSKEKTYQARLY